MIAIVDDDFRVLESLENLLEAEGYDVKAFSSAEEFIADSDHMIFECVISDISMPGMGGLALLRRMQVERRAVPVIMITARGPQYDKELFIRAGARGVFQKPFDGAELLHAISVALAAAPRDSTDS